MVRPSKKRITQKMAIQAAAEKRRKANIGESDHFRIWLFWQWYLESMNTSLGVSELELGDNAANSTGKVHYLQLYCNLQ